MLKSLCSAKSLFAAGALSVALFSAAPATAQTQLPIPPFASTFSSATLTRGYWFQCPANIFITGLQVPDESGHGTQNVEVFVMASAPPVWSASATGGQVFYQTGVPSNQIIPCQIPVNAGDYVGVLGACGDASIMHSSYSGGGPHSSTILGMPVTLDRFLTQTNIVASGGSQPYSQEPGGALGRVDLWYTPQQGLFPGFSATPTSGNSPLNVQFTDSSFTSDPGGITSYSWDFGDGSAPATVANPMHTYTSCGNYTVALTVTDATGSATETKMNYIDVDAITADFTASPTTGSCGSLTVTFTDTSTGNPTMWAWDFDNDGTVDSTLQNPTYTYNGSGSFSPSLTASSSCSSDTITKTDLISLEGRLTTLFASNNGGNVGGSIQFDLTVSTQALAFSGIETNFSATVGTGVGADIWVTAVGGTHVGNQTNQSLWTQVATGTGTSAGTDQPTRITFASPMTLQPGTYGVTIVAVGSANRYTNGTGANQTYSNNDLALSLGTALNVPWTGTPFTPRVWNGTWLYCDACAGSTSTNGAGCADATGTQLAMDISGCPDLGDTYNVGVATGAANNLPAFFILGVSDQFLGPILLPIDLTPFGAPGCSAYTSQETLLGPFANPGGGAGFSSVIPMDPFLVGGTIYSQAWQLAPGVNALNVISSNYATSVIG
ncbi:MAG: PKD domain-containing protein [Planctomycetes bacterium]|nr:PKD domain-containing protein [Planctomycetota bacterium]MCB9891544.1 PKD domain-containing protein [Planctomycetota bacterium]